MRYLDGPCASGVDVINFSKVDRVGKVDLAQAAVVLVEHALVLPHRVPRHLSVVKHFVVKHRV